jgi:MFS family permease
MNGRADYPSSRIGWNGVAMLCILYFMSFVDRSVLSLLVGPIKSSLAVSDIAMGFLMGPSFALFYGVIGLPIAALADRGNRRRLILAGVLLWSLCTVGSAFVTSFWQFAALRAGLAIGEAVLTPAAYTLIADWFSVKKRHLPTTVYAWSGQLGAMLGVAVIALLIRWVFEQGGLRGIAFFDQFQRWQLIFLVLGSATLVCWVAAIGVLREPKRIETAGEHHDTGLIDTMKFMGRNPRLYVGLILGCGFNTIVLAGFLAWGPQLMERSYGWKMSDIGFAIGTALTVSSVAGLLLIPRAIDWWRERTGNPAIPANLSILASIAGNFLFTAGSLASSAFLFLVLMASGVAFVCAAGLLATTSIPIIAPARMRAVISATYLLITSAFSLSIGPVLVPFFAGVWALGSGQQSLAKGIFACSLMVPALTVPLMLWMRKPLTEELQRKLYGSA